MKIRKHKPLSRTLCYVICVLWMIPSITLGQKEADRDERFDQQPPQQRRRDRARDPDAIRRRIEQLERQLDDMTIDDPHSPKIEQLERRVGRLRKILQRLESGQARGRRGALGQSGARARRGGHGGPQDRPFSPQEVRKFIDQHPELARIFGTRPDGSPAADEYRRQLLQRNRHKIERIMRAQQQGDEGLAGLLMASAELQFEIGQKVWQFRNADFPAEEKQAIQEQLAELMHQQVEQELALRESEIRKLEERLESQRRELHDSRMNVDELAARKLQQILSGEDPGEGRRRAGARGRRGQRRRGVDQAPPPHDDEPR